MQLIETVTLASSASTIQFTSIPQDGVDLLLLLAGRHDLNGTVNVSLQVNNNTSAIYDYRSLEGNGSSAESSGLTGRTTLYSGILSGANLTSNTFTNQAFYFTNYTSSANKSLSIDAVQENNATAARQSLIAGLINTTSAITSTKFSLDSGAVFVQNSTASLYKIS